MLTKPKPTKSGLTLLELCFNPICNQKLIIKMNKISARTMIIFDFAQVDYKNKSKTIIIKIEEIIDLLKILKSKLQLCLRNKMILHPSLKKSLGYYKAQLSQNNKNKNILRIKKSDGYFEWVGAKHLLFNGIPRLKIPYSWLYNDKDGNIML